MLIRTAIAFVGLACLTAHAQDATPSLQDLEQQQRKLQEQIDQQQRKLDELEQRAAAAAPAPAAVKADASAPDSGSVSWKEISALGSKFKLYGFLNLEAIHDDSRPNNTQTMAWVLSEDAAAPVGIGAGSRNREDFTMHARNTRFGFDFLGPDIELLGHPALTGKLEIDFYNNGLQGQSESRAALRMRHAYLKLAWKDLSVLAGQTWDIISPIFPVVNPDFMMWGAGNLGDRRPQLRGEYRPALGDGFLSVQGGLMLTGAVDNQDLDAAGNFGNPYRDGEASGQPTMQARIGYSVPLFEQTLDVGVWAHRAQEHVDTALNGQNEFASRAVGADLTLPLVSDWLWVKSEVWRGENLDDVRGGILQGINATTGKGIDSHGGFGELGLKPLKWATAYTGYSIDNPDDRDLNTGGRAINRVWYVASRFDFGAVKMGLEYLHWTTGYVGFDEGVDNRIMAFVSYYF